MDAWRKEKRSEFDQTVHDITWYCFSPSTEFLHTGSSTCSNTWPFRPILGNWSSHTVALMQGDSFFLFESSTNGTAFHKRQLMPALWTCSRTSYTRSLTAGWVSLWTHSPRNPTWLYNATIQYQTWHRQLQQKLIWSHWCSCTRWATQWALRYPSTVSALSAFRYWSLSPATYDYRCPRCLRRLNCLHRSCR